MTKTIAKRTIKGATKTVTPKTAIISVKLPAGYKDLAAAKCTALSNTMRKNLKGAFGTRIAKNLNVEVKFNVEA